MKNFEYVIGLCCFLYVIDNIKCYFWGNDLQVIEKDVIVDIFGKCEGLSYQMGLVDFIDDEDFELKFEFCIEKWEIFEMLLINLVVKIIFLEWFKKNFVDVVKKFMLVLIRWCVGLGGQLIVWYINNNFEFIYYKVKDDK